MGQISSKYGEIIKNLISVFGEKPARGLPKPPPTPPRPDYAEFTRGENADVESTRWIETRRKGRGGENNEILNNSITKWYFDAILHMKIGIPFLLLNSLTNCAHILLASLASKNRDLYSEGSVYKRTSELAASPQSTALHSTGNTSVKNSVTRMKSATATHRE